MTLTPSTGLSPQAASLPLHRSRSPAPARIAVLVATRIPPSPVGERIRPAAAAIAGLRDHPITATAGPRTLRLYEDME